jgi:hypothetical protein
MNSDPAASTIWAIATFRPDHEASLSVTLEAVPAMGVT